MKHTVYFSLLFLMSLQISEAQQVVNDKIGSDMVSLFLNQLEAFPQEKIYLHTDKPYYISGERIWFRAHLADAATHYPVSYSRYVYVELINPLDSIVSRVKIRQDEEEAYHGCLPIPSDVPEGDYTMRAYTTFMRSQDENYFCTKTIRIGDPQARVVHTETLFSFESGRRGRTHATFRFSSPSQSPSMGGRGTPLVPKSVRVSVNNGQMMNIEVDDDGTASVNFETPSNSPKGGGQSSSFGGVRGGFILLEVVAFNHPYRQFIQIPVPDDDFDVSFYPEGGSLMQGTNCMTGFKAMKSNGQATNITGVVYDHTGTEILKFESEHLGMGRFMLGTEKGKTYYAICQNDKGQSKRFELPPLVNHGYALTVSSYGNRIYVSALKPAENTENDDLYLLAHTRGVVHFVRYLEPDLPQIVLPCDLFPSGVLHFILFDGDLNPVSERLIFINNRDQAQVSYQPEQVNFTRRSLVKNRVTLTDSEGEPLTGSFSVAVTSDREVPPDSTSNILSQLLLTSDLRGNIENPAYYFQNTRSSAYKLDLLMLTQGWRRYDIAELAQGRFSEPTTPVEVGPEISGTVKSVLLGRPVEDVEVTAVSFTGGFINSALTDKEGRFYLPIREFPDSTLFTVNVENKRGMTRMELVLDEETFPGKTLPLALTSEVDKYQFAKYADKAEQKYIDENGERIYELQEVTITAQRIPPRKSLYYSNPSNTVTEEELKNIGAIDIYSVLRRIPGVQLIPGGSLSQKYHIQIRGYDVWSGNAQPDGNTQPLENTRSMSSATQPLILINDVPVEGALDMILIDNIVQIDVLKGGQVAIFGSRGMNGVISIYTKRADTDQPIAMDSPSLLFHIKSVLPLGYQKPIEFYAPKYDTPEKRNAQAPDLRTTIHWQPVVQTDSAGVASFEFYTADEQTSYTVVVEGLTDEGKIIRQERKLWRKDEQ